MKPFIKGAGGKSQLLPYIRTKYPVELGSEITKYCEPFMGGGAVLFDILENHSLNEILVNDINQELTNVYNQIKYDVNSLIEELESIQNKFWEMDLETRKTYYYKKKETGLII